ncbi:coiled-coil domain-containing protein 160 [Rhinophrynus dorsalis]
MEEEKKHWVERLFPPHFSAQDFYNQNFEPEQLVSERLEVARVKAVEKIYNAAVQRFQETEKLKRKEYWSKLIAKEYESSGSVKNTEQTQLAEDQSGTCRSCGKLRAALAVSKRNRLCKSLLMRHLEKDMPKKDAEIQALKKDLHGKSTMLSSLENNLSKAREEIQDLKLNNKDLEKKLKTLKQQQDLKYAISVERLQHKHRLEISKLLKEISYFKEEMNKERIQHARAIHALDLLRKRFTSLSVNTNPALVQPNIQPQ